VGKTTRRKAKGAAGATDAHEARLVLSLHLKRPRRQRRRLGSAADLAELSRRISRKDLAAERKRALAKPMAALRRFAKTHRMKVLEVDPPGCRVKLSVQSGDAGRIFATTLRRVEAGGVSYLYPVRRPRLPRALARFTDAVLGLDQRPVASRLRAMAGGNGRDGILPSEMARLYGMIVPGQGAGQCIGIVSPRGGYKPDDLKTACEAMGVPPPTVVEVNIGKGRNSFGADSEADKEVSLDLQVVAGVAPRARVVIYFTEPTEAGYADGVAQAVHDDVNRPSVIVFTWGESEDFWPKAARAALDATLGDAVRLGVTVVAAAGDDLATERRGDGEVHVDYPASSPYVLGCGGTEITLDAAGNAIAGEVVWNAGARGTGGGISDVFSVPSYQNGVDLPPSLNDGARRRGVPDVAAAASETNGYRIVLNGSEVVTGGTSAAAPLWAAFIAALNGQRGEPLGFVNQLLYKNRAWLRPITSGNNMMFGLGYSAGPGWNACAGLGVPVGQTITAAVAAAAAVA
jgi:kumamolisin